MFTHHKICLPVSQAQLFQWSRSCLTELRLSWCMPRRLGHLLGEHGRGWLLGQSTLGPWCYLQSACYSGSDSITSANEPHAGFLRPSSIRSVVSFCVFKDYRLCHLQSQTVCKGNAMTKFWFYILFFVLRRFLRAGKSWTDL